MKKSIATAALAAAALAAPAFAQTVKVTPLGGVEGEFCVQDRALVFEDPNGTRILYDPGRTVAGGPGAMAMRSSPMRRAPLAVSAVASVDLP